MLQNAGYSPFHSVSLIEPGSPGSGQGQQLSLTAWLGVLGLPRSHSQAWPGSLLPQPQVLFLSLRQMPPILPASEESVLALFPVNFGEESSFHPAHEGSSKTHHFSICLGTITVHPEKSGHALSLPPISILPLSALLPVTVRKSLSCPGVLEVVLD